MVSPFYSIGPNGIIFHTV